MSNVLTEILNCLSFEMPVVSGVHKGRNLNGQEVTIVIEKEERDITATDVERGNINEHGEFVKDDDGKFAVERVYKSSTLEQIWVLDSIIGTQYPIAPGSVYKAYGYRILRFMLAKDKASEPELIDIILDSFTSYTEEEDRYLGEIEGHVVIVTPYTGSGKFFSIQSSSTTVYAAKWLGNGLSRELNGPIAGRTGYTEEGCRLIHVGFYDGKEFTPSLTLEVRTEVEHANIEAAVQFGKRMMELAQRFVADNPEYVEQEREITKLNPQQVRPIEFKDDIVNLWIPRIDTYIDQWYGRLALDITTGKFTYWLTDIVENEMCSVADVWPELEISKTEFFIRSLIEKPVLPRNKDGILY